MKKPWKNTPDLWEWLHEHPMVHYVDDEHPEFMNSVFHMALDIQFVFVNPKNNKVSKNQKKNTKQQCWLEFGPAYYHVEATRWEASHDWKLDCGAKTFEKALWKLGKKILKHYGDYKRNNRYPLCAKMYPTLPKKSAINSAH